MRFFRSWQCFTLGLLSPRWNVSPREWRCVLGQTGGILPWRDGGAAAEQGSHNFISGGVFLCCPCLSKGAVCNNQSWCSGFNSSSTRSNVPEKFLTLKKLSFSPCAKMRAVIWIIVVCDYSSVKNKYSCDFKSNWAWFSLGLVVALGFSSMAWSQAPWGDSEGGDLVCRVRFVPWNLGARGCSLL